MSFLISLNDTYIAVRGQILLMDPIPSLSKVFSLLVQDEKQRKVGKNPTTEASALAVKNNGSFVKDLIRVSLVDLSALIVELWPCC